MTIDYTKDYYEILTLPKDATTEEIINAYKGQIKIFHPDNCRSENLRRTYEEKFKEIQETYEVLINNQLREEYNKFRKTYQKVRQLMITIKIKCLMIFGEKWHMLVMDCIMQKKKYI